MTPEQFIQALNTKTVAFKRYMNDVWPKEAGAVSIRFINGNFRAQGWQGNSFQPWQALKKPRDKGSILRKTGHLASSFYFNTHPGQAIVRTSVPYAKAHNEGFKGKVNVKATVRRVKTVTGITEVPVKAFSRNMNLPKRQFMPHDMYNSPVFLNAIKRKTINGMKNIFNQ
jgi:phage gpG-like protein